MLEDIGRSPCGERGLKFTVQLDDVRIADSSLPVRGAWVEIYCSGGVLSAGGVAPRAGSVG